MICAVISACWVNYLMNRETEHMKTNTKFCLIKTANSPLWGTATDDSCLFLSCENRVNIFCKQVTRLEACNTCNIQILNVCQQLQVTLNSLQVSHDTQQDRTQLTTTTPLFCILYLITTVNKWLHERVWTSSTHSNIQREMMHTERLRHKYTDTVQYSLIKHHITDKNNTNNACTTHK